MNPVLISEALLIYRKRRRLSKGQVDRRQAHHTISASISLASGKGLASIEVKSLNFEQASEDELVSGYTQPRFWLDMQQPRSPTLLARLGRAPLL